TEVTAKAQAASLQSGRELSFVQKATATAAKNKSLVNPLFAVFNLRALREMHYVNECNTVTV
uniref:hypothetical protein n=1 Tax=Klebsiella pneumoniae TaxID=573 RepID=UPI001D0F0D39